MKSVFISYSHHDREFCNALITHLRVLQHKQLITTWHDGELTPGSAWQSVIDDKLRNSDIIIILVSADFLASRFCQDVELSSALKRWETKDTTIIPVIVRDCDWQASALVGLQALPSGAKPVRQWSDHDEAWAHVTRRIRAVVESSKHPVPSPAAPAPASSPIVQPLAGTPPVRSLIVLGNRAMFENFATRLANAESIDVHEYSMQGKPMDFLLNKARAGCKLRLLLLDPTSSTVEMVAGLTQAGELLRQDIERTIAYLDRRVLIHDNAELRFTSVPTPFSLIIADRETPRGRIEVELCAYDVVADDRPRFVLLPNDEKHWYAFFVTQFDRLWQDARRHEVGSVPAEAGPRIANSGKGRRVDREHFLAACTPAAATLFAFLLDEAVRRGHRIYWGTSGFSLGSQLSGEADRWSFAYGYPPDDFQFYFQEGAPWSGPDDATAFRRTLLSTGIFREAGRLTLKSRVDNATSARAHEAARQIFDRVEESIRQVSERSESA
jgi:hypothetical protein